MTKPLQFHDGQSLVAKDNHRFKILCCGRRWGKTIYDVTAMVNKAIHTDDGHITYIAPTYQQARDIAWAELKKTAQPVAKKVNETRLEIVVRSKVPKRDPITHKLILAPKTQEQIDKHQNPSPVYVPSTSTISLRGWESVETLRGQKFHMLVLDEVAMMKNFNAYWAEVLLPTLTDYKGEAIFSSTPRGFNHFYDLFNKEATDSEYKSFRFPSKTNPYLPIDDLEKYRFQMTEDQYAQEYEADFRKTEGLVYKSFNRDVHVYDEKTITPKFVETFYGIDFGFTNPSAVVVIRKDSDANYWITDEIYQTQLTNTELIEKVKQLTPQPRYIYADPAEPDRIKEFRANRYYMRDVRKGKGSIINGIQRIEELLKTNRIKIEKHCQGIITEFEMYSYPKNKTMRNDTENPEPANDHALDALRMALVTHDPYSHGAGYRMNASPIATPGSIAEELKKRHQKKQTKTYD